MSEGWVRLTGGIANIHKIEVPMAENELLPCPKGCASPPQHMKIEFNRSVGNADWNKRQSRIWCSTCGLMQIVTEKDDGDDCIKAVRKAWNTRPTEGPATVSVEGLVANLVDTIIEEIGDRGAFNGWDAETFQETRDALAAHITAALSQHTEGK